MESQTERTGDEKIAEGASAQIADAVTADSLKKSVPVELTPSARGSTLDEVDLSASSKEAEGDITEEKERGWTVVDLSHSPSVEIKTESAPSSASSTKGGD